MPMILTDIEARILGSLIEKSLTTPDLYPLTLNSLLNACNQKSSRDPVMALDETQVAEGLTLLHEKGLVSRRNEPNSRVTKFLHNVDVLLPTGTSQDIGAICLLLLRGPQTPGEIRTRAERLCRFETPAEVETLLNDLATRPGGPYVERLPRQSGQKELRWRHLFISIDAHPPAPPTFLPAALTPSAPKEDRISLLEKRVENLEHQVQDLRVRHIPK